jgi:hypothetical protein
LVAVCLASGFINLVPLGGLLPATLLIDGLVLLMGLLAAVDLVRSGHVEAWMVGVGAVVLVGAVLVLHGTEPVSSQVLALRNLIWYAVPAVYCAVAIRSTRGAELVIRAIMRWGLVLAVFGCVQFVLRNTLPGWLLYSKDTELFGYYGSDIIRTTGLIGNSIVFATFLVMLFALWVARSLWRPTVHAFVATMVVALAIMSTLSRNPMACALAIAAGLVLVRVAQGGMARGVRFIYLGLAVGGLLAIGLMLSTRLQQAIFGSFLWQGVVHSGNASVTQSTLLHDQFTQLALASFKAHPWFGIGLGTQSQDSSNAATNLVITDGFHLSLLVEGGLVLLTVVLVLLLTVLVRLNKARREVPQSLQFAPTALFAYLLSQIALAGFYNTGFFGKVPNVLFWVAAGSVISLARSMSLVTPSGSSSLYRRSMGKKSS